MEVGVVLIGNLSFPIDITVEVTFASAICKLEKENFTYYQFKECMLLLQLN